MGSVGRGYPGHIFSKFRSTDILCSYNFLIFIESSTYKSTNEDLWFDNWIGPMMTSSPEMEIPLPVLERLIRTSVKLGKKISEKILNRNLIGNQLLQMALIVVKIAKTSTSKPDDKTVDLTSKILSKTLFDYNEKVKSSFVDMLSLKKNS